MIYRVVTRIFLFSLSACLIASAQPSENYDRSGENWDSIYSAEEGGGSSYLGVDIADVSPERLGELKLKEEHGAEVTMVDQDAPAGKAGLHEHDVIVSLNGAGVESAAQLRRMIKETPAGRIVNLGISRDGQPMMIKLQLADRHKMKEWEPSMKVEMPEMPEIPSVPDFDVPVSVVIVHQSARSGLMVENITPQLGDFFGVKSGNGVLVRSVEKGSRGEKAGFRAGDVVVKVNNQSVHDTSDFTHALRSSSGATAAVTVLREKREQNLTLTLPAKKDSGNLIEESIDDSDSDFTAQTQQAINRAGAEMARLTPAISERVRHEQDRHVREIEQQLRQSQRRIAERQREIEEQNRRLTHELSGKWADI